MVRFDKEAFRRALDASLADRLPDLTAPGRSAFFVYRGELDLLGIARGMAAACKRPSKVIELLSEDLESGDAGPLLGPLLTGGVLFLVHAGPSDIPATLADCWPKFCVNPEGYSASVARGLMLDRHLLPADAYGAVMVLQSASMARARSTLAEWPLLESEAAELTALADQYEASTISVRSAATAKLRDNQQAYREYGELVQAISGACHDRALGQDILRRTISGADPHDLKADFLYHGIGGVLFDELFDRLSALAAHCREIQGGFSEDEALPDVYAAALMIRSLWEPAEDHSLIYRGQRNAAWKVVPSFFRSLPDGSAADVAEREHRLKTFVGLMQEAYPELNESQCVAAAQHVSSEAGTPTWLIDVTWDPLVALFFASSGGQPGDLGIVDQVVMVEWEEHVADSPDIPGGLISIEVPVIERLRRQRGLFLNAPRADLYELYSPHRIWFRQQAGLEFSDPSSDAPISKASLLPPEPRLEKVILSLDQAAADTTVQGDVFVARPGDPAVPLTAETLLRPLERQQEVQELNSYHRLVLEVVCELFARPAEWVVDDQGSKYSSYRLHEVVSRLAVHQKSGLRCHLESALEWTKSRLRDDDLSALIHLGHQLWMKRYRIPPAVVVEGMTKLLGLTHRLAPTVLGVTFPGPGDHADLVMQTLAGKKDWRFHDLRSSTEDDVLRVAAELVAGGVVLIAADPTLEPEPLRVLADAVARRRSAVWVGNKHVDVSGDTIMAFVFGAARLLKMIEARDMIACALNIDEFGSTPTGAPE